MFCILGILVLMKGVGATQGLEADSKITAVTVYRDQALITRNVSLDLEPGDYEVFFPHLLGAILKRFPAQLRQRNGHGEDFGAGDEWKLELKPGRKKVIEFEFLIEYPRDMHVPGI